MIVAIVSVDTAQRKAEGLNRYRSRVTIDLNYHVGAVLVTPAVGEQWYVERVQNNDYTLLSKIPFNDPGVLVDATEGMVQVGSSGPLELSGSALNANGPLRLSPTNGEMPAADAGAIVYSTTDKTPLYFDGGVWRPLTTLQPWDLLGLVIFSATTTRTTGTGDFPFGVSLPRSVRLDSATYRTRTADASGNLVVELRRNGVTVPASSVTIPASAQVTGATMTGPWAFLSGDILTVHVTGVGSSPGQGLVADIKGIATALAEAGATLAVTASRLAKLGIGASASLVVTATRPAVMLESPTLNADRVITATETAAAQYAGGIAGSLPVSATASATAIVSAPLSVIGTPGATNANTIILPTHAVGDDIFIFAFNGSGTTAVTKPTATGSVPAWGDIDAPAGSNGCYARTAHFVAVANNHTSGTWTNATSMAVIVVRGQNAAPVGGHALSGGSATNQAVAPAVTLSQADGSSMILEFYGQTGTNDLDNWDAAPTGYTRRAATTQASGSTRSCLNTKNVTTTDGSIIQTGPTAFFSHGYQGATIEILH